MFTWMKLKGKGIGATYGVLIRHSHFLFLHFHSIWEIMDVKGITLLYLLFLPRKDGSHIVFFDMSNSFGQLNITLYIISSFPVAPTGVPRWSSGDIFASMEQGLISGGRMPTETNPLT